MRSPEKLQGRQGLLRYQSDWLRSEDRFKIGLWSRQSGKDFTCAAEAVLDCFRNPKTHWLILACGERQALETMAKAREWVELAGLGRSDERGGRKSEARVKQAEIRWSNGSRLTAIPAKPETIRGYSANLILTEFAFHEQAEEIWKAIYPAISNPLRGGGKKIRIITTPNGQGNRFNELWRGSDYGKAKVAIRDAVKEGLPLELGALRAGIDDSDAWAQEYNCEFVDTSAVLLPYELIARCEAPEANEAATVMGISRVENELFMGVDFGRKHDLTVCWTLERAGDELITREVFTLEKAPTPDQIAALTPRLARARRACLDYTGAGIGLGDHVVKTLGEWNPGQHGAGRVELCQFTAALKGELFPRLRAAMEQGRVRIPASRAIREDLHGMHRVVSPTGVLTYRASHTADGHSDRCAALALALRAAELSPP